MPTNKSAGVSESETSNLKSVHEEFAMKWVVHDKESENIGHSLFTHSNGQSSNTYFEENFEPEWDLTPEIPENV